MEAKAVDPGEFRDAQKKQWDTAATGWRKHSDFIDNATGEISRRLVELAGVEQGSRVLDVAAGYGEPSLTAARAAGTEGKVVATDISAEMLAYGRERAEAAGIENIEFQNADASTLDFPAESFDAAVSRWGIIFEPDGEGAAARVRGFLKPGSRMAISSWGEPEQVPFIALPMKTAFQHLGIDPPPPGTPGPLSRPTPEALGSLLEGGGFSDVEVEDTTVTMEWDSPEQFTEFTHEIVAPLTALIEQQPEDVQKETWNAITEAIRQAGGGGDGPVSFTSVVLLASGRA
jgi:ubiquinone/menaquinone biosynthesis C-methylase UbiE